MRTNLTIKAKNKDALVLGKELGGRIAKALGLQLVTALSINTPVKGIATVKVEMALTVEQADKIEEIVKDYKAAEESK